MTKEQFDELIYEVIPQQLFHVSPDDLDDESGGKLDETILVGLIAQDPSCLKHKPLQWFLDTFLIKMETNFEAEREDHERKNYEDGLQEEQNLEEKELFRQIQEDEREGEVCPDCMGAGETVFGGSFGGATHHQPCIRCNGTGRIKE